MSNALREPGQSIAWPKGRAPESRLLFELASNQVILDLLENLVGANLALFSASIVTRAPGQIHPWHTDVETAHSHGNAISVWVGIENTNANSSLQVISRSHAIGETIQQVAAEHGTKRSEVSISDVTEWSQGRDPKCEFVNVAMTNGMAVVFDGRLWHGSDNTNKRGTRTAILLQYSTPDFPVRIPEPATLTWPFAYQETPKPPCIMVRGSTESTVNEYVPPPDRDQARGTLITKWIRQLNLPLERNYKKGWRPHPIFNGRTRIHDAMSCHVSVLEPGHTPHPPHKHDEEEILIVLDGAADLISVPNDDGREVRRRVSRGDFAYYPAGFLHTINAPTDEPATYLMFKWAGRSSPTDGALPSSFANYDDFLPNGESEFASKVVFDGPTGLLRKLHCHTSALALGSGYSPHIDAHDVAIVVLDGTIVSMGEDVRKNGVVYFSAGEPHDMQNAGQETAHYLVFEFHADGRLTDMGWRYNAEQTIRSLKRLAKRLGAKKAVSALKSFRK